MTEIIKKEVEQIFLDYDDKIFDEVMNSPIKESNLSKVLQTAAKMHIQIDCVCIRRSSGGRLHILIALDQPISFIWSMIFRIRLDDCIGRVTSDFNRYLESGGDITRVNRLFNYKLVNGEQRRAGEWIMLYHAKNTTLNDFEKKQNDIIEA